MNGRCQGFFCGAAVAALRTRHQTNDGCCSQHKDNR
jgi:glycerol-3-phosphate dehydrogenase